ncbi:hypothetical protein CEXT_652501 [Caerostris extrusa]|uniref:Uncharacterized protein n=1 Tax=Caerostris extrusa TaxID=172846 RepID=A0AAV4SP74_CAEEX|nr:hypothetical protein CEXT_652501 [Caerostris extrusa]
MVSDRKCGMFSLLLGNPITYNWLDDKVVKRLVIVNCEANKVSEADYLTLRMNLMFSLCSNFGISPTDHHTPLPSATLPVTKISGTF